MESNIDGCIGRSQRGQSMSLFSQRHVRNPSTFNTYNQNQQLQNLFKPNEHPPVHHALMTVSPGITRSKWAAGPSVSFQCLHLKHLKIHYGRIRSWSHPLRWQNTLKETGTNGFPIQRSSCNLIRHSNSLQIARHPKFLLWIAFSGRRLGTAKGNSDWRHAQCSPSAAEVQ